MWPRKKFWWETGGTPPLQSPNPAATIPGDDPMFKWQAGMAFPTVPLETFDESKAAFSPIIPAARQASQTPSSGAVARKWRHGQMMGPNYGIGSPYVLEAGGNAAINAAMARQPSQTPTAPKKSNKLKYIVEALQELEGPEPPKLAGGNFGRAMPRALGFSLPGMGGRLEEQEAMSKARREEELRRRMKLMGGGY